MESRGTVRFCGFAAMLAGILRCLFVVLAAMKPVGCIRESCLYRSMRDTSDLVPILIPAVVLLGWLGVILKARRVGSYGRTMRFGLVLLAVGAAVLLVAHLVQSLFYNEEFPLMPTMVIPGGVVHAVGVLLLGVAMLRLMPRWIGAAFVFAALSLVLSNDQDAKVLLLIPFGLAWAAVGYELLRERSGPLLAGVHPKVVSERLGHASIRETLDTYSHVLPSMQQHAAGKLDELLFRGGGEAAEAVNTNLS